MLSLLRGVLGLRQALGLLQALGQLVLELLVSHLLEQLGIAILACLEDLATVGALDLVHGTPLFNTAERMP